MTQTHDHFSQEFLEKIQEQLEEKRASLSGDLSQIEDETLGESTKNQTGDLSSMPIHSADVATDQYEQNQRLNQIERKRQELEQILLALEKLEEGDFGSCEECESFIDKERLKAIPYAPLCIECAKEAESS